MNGLVFAIAVSIAAIPGTALSQGYGAQPGHTQIGRRFRRNSSSPCPRSTAWVSWKTLAQVQPVK